MPIGIGYGPDAIGQSAYLASNVKSPAASQAAQPQVGETQSAPADSARLDTARAVRASEEGGASRQSSNRDDAPPSQAGALRPSAGAQSAQLSSQTGIALLQYTSDDY